MVAERACMARVSLRRREMVCLEREVVFDTPLEDSVRGRAAEKASELERRNETGERCK